jgi:hypothetical protein
LFFAQRRSIAKDETIVWGRILKKPSHLLTSYQTFAATLQWRNKCVADSGTKPQKTHCPWGGSIILRFKRLSFVWMRSSRSCQENAIKSFIYDIASRALKNSNSERKKFWCFVYSTNDGVRNFFNRVGTIYINF